MFVFIMICKWFYDIWIGIWRALVVWSETPNKPEEIDKRFVISDDLRMNLNRYLFDPYYNKSIKMKIKTLDEHNMIQDILNMDEIQIQEFGIDLETEMLLDEKFKNSRIYKLKHRAYIRCSQEMKKSNLYQTIEMQNQPNELSIGEIYEQYMFSNIICDLNDQAIERRGW